MRLRVLIVCYEFPPIGGGTGRALSNLLWEYTNCKDLSIDVLTSHSGRGVRTERYSDNVWIYRIGVKKKSLHYWSMAEILSWHFKAWIYYKRLHLWDYDLVHSFYGFPTALFAYFTRRKVPYIISLRGSDVPGFNKRAVIPKKLNLKIWQCAKSIVCNSSYLAKLAGLRSSVIIPNGVNSKQLKRHTEDNKLTVLTAGRLIKRKRIEMIIKACKGHNLLIAGDGPEKKSLMSMSDGNVKFLGHVENMDHVFDVSDVYISASKHEGMSNSILEAMASGLPLIVSSCSSELINGNGYVADSAEEIKICLSKIDKKNQSTASTDFAKCFSWQKTANEYIEVYKKALEVCEVSHRNYIQLGVVK